MYAAGLSMPVENVEAFRERFERVVRETMPPEMRIPVEEIDLEIGLELINDRLVRDVQHMAPFGPRNMRPVFLSRGVVDSGGARIVGEDHLKLTVHAPTRPNKRFDAIAFRQGKHFDMVKSGEPFSILYVLEENIWQGRRSLQLNVKDIKAGTEGLLENEHVNESSKAIPVP